MWEGNEGREREAEGGVRKSHSVIRIDPQTIFFYRLQLSY